MLLPLIAPNLARLVASPPHASVPAQASPARRKAPVAWPAVLVVTLVLVAHALQAGTIAIPNGSFESPVIPFADTNISDWQKSPEPAWYAQSTYTNAAWETRMGTFYNLPIPSSFIDNCDGTQAAFVFALPDVAVFQDYDSIYGTNTTPSHAFDAKFNVNRAYNLTVGVIGGVYTAMHEGTTLQLSLYYRDPSSNMVTVAATTITNSVDLFPTNTHFVDFSVYVPGVRATNLWAGQNIGVQIASTVSSNLVGGYWDVDNVRLTETVLPALTNPGMSNSQFGFTLESQPGLRFQILAATNLSMPLSNWASLGTLTNDTGLIPFLDPAPNPNRCFYRARQLP